VDRQDAEMMSVHGSEKSDRTKTCRSAIIGKGPCKLICDNVKRETQSRKNKKIMNMKNAKERRKEWVKGNKNKRER